MPKCCQLVEERQGYDGFPVSCLESGVQEREAKNNP